MKGPTYHFSAHRTPINKLQYKCPKTSISINLHKTSTAVLYEYYEQFVVPLRAQIKFSDGSGSSSTTK